MNAHDFLNTFAHLADAPGGVDRLRELILQLAVRGKLVEQDASDEPAEVLLERIEAEKKRLYEAGEIRKPKSIKKIEMDTVPFGISKTWSWCRIGHLALDIQYGYTASATHQPTNARFVRISDIQNNKVNWPLVPYCEIEPAKIDNYKLFNGDLLIARTGGTIGKTYLVRDLDEIAVFASYLIRVHVADVVDSDYLYHFAHSPLYWAQLYSESKGTGQPNVNATALRNLVIPLPPLAEQKRIVTRVDELMELCNELETHKSARVEIHGQLHASALDRLTSSEDPTDFATNWARVRDNFDLLFDTPDSIDALRQTILELAVRGKLVEQDPDDEPAEVLLERIEAEKKRLYEAGEIRKPKRIKKPISSESTYILPNSWQWERLGNLIYDIEAGWSPKCRNHPARKGRWGVLKTTAVQPLKFWPHKNKELPDELEPREDYEAKPGDLLITRAGPKNRVGIACAVQETPSRLMLSDKIIRCHLIHSLLDPQYVALALSAGYSREFLGKIKSGMAASQMNISQTRLKNTPIPIPPFNEQFKILTRVDELMELCDAMEDLIRQRQAKAERFAEAVVHAAASDEFDGEYEIAEHGSKETAQDELVIL